MKKDSGSLVMVVDDNPKNLQVLGGLLRENGFKIAVARNGMQVLEYLETRQPDLILLDVMMPGMDGFEVCRRIKKDEATRRIPVLFITALTDTNNKLTGFAAGGEDYITKPFFKEEVMARVNVFIERQKAQKALKKSNTRLEKWNETLEEKVKDRTASLKKMQSKIVMQEKMASIGQLAAGIAHELNNPINFIYTNFITLQENFTGIKFILENYQHLVNKISLSPERQALLETITEKEKSIHLDFILKDLGNLFSETREGFKRTSWIINSMRDFSRTEQAHDFSFFDINKGIRDTLVIARNEYKYDCEIKTEMGKLPELLCIPQQLNQVFLILIVNASQAIKSQDRKDRGTIFIRTFVKNGDICCQIIDDGPGVAGDLQSRIFEPFFTTKDVGKGTGLGLSIAYDIIVNKHGGTLNLETGIQDKTIFSICLPVKKETKDEG